MSYLLGEAGWQYGHHDLEDGGGAEGRVDHHRPLRRARVVLVRHLHNTHTYIKTYLKIHPHIYI
jgi:hypothetical protein